MSLNSRDPGISKFVFPNLAEMLSLMARSSSDTDLIFCGGDLSPATLVTAYQSGLFPMPLDETTLGWFCPAQRGVFLTIEGSYSKLPVRISRSLRKSMTKFSYSVNLAFEQVVSNCADPARAGSWITPEVGEAYARLHTMGWAHSFEVWSDEGGTKKLVGGLYGVAIGGLFAGESMFHTRTDASKAALVTLAATMAKNGGIVIDAQWNTPHLSSLGAVTIPRVDYLELLGEALSRPTPKLFEQSYRGPICEAP